MRKIALWGNNRRTSPALANRLIGKLLDDLGSSSSGTRRSRGRSVDIYEKDGKLNYELELPGFSKDDIQVKTQKGKLLITGEKDEEEINTDRNYLTKSRSHNQVRRSFPLPEGIETSDDLDAEYDNGILHIAVPIPNKQESETVEVEIK